MERLTPFAQMPTTPEPIIAQVRRQLGNDVPSGRRIEATVLAHLAEQAVRDLWASPIKTFVPVLALRQARELLRDHDLLITVDHAEDRTVPTSPALPSEADRTRRDVLAIPGDVLPLGEEDVLSL